MRGTGDRWRGAAERVGRKEQVPEALWKRKGEEFICVGFAGERGQRSQ